MLSGQVEDDVLVVVRVLLVESSQQVVAVVDVRQTNHLEVKVTTAILEGGEEQLETAEACNEELVQDGRGGGWEREKEGRWRMRGRGDGRMMRGRAREVGSEGRERLSMSQRTQNI